ncbi:MAG: hypothetical protein NXI12_04175 [Alphaproteobacteria bacterium]|nr:hypothetical protein [Alphaproteobacteria bacterium]
MKSVSGGTSIFSKYALPPGTPISDAMASQGFFDPTNTGNAYIDMVNTFALVGTGELSPAALERYLTNPCEEVGSIYHDENVGPLDDFIRYSWEVFQGEMIEHEGYWDDFIKDDYIACMENVMRNHGYNVPQ